MIVNFHSAQPQIGSDVFVAPDAWIIGDVTLGERVSIFFGAVLRGDILPIRIGRGTNIQEHAVVHTSGGRTPALVGDDVTVGHRAIIHGCSIGNRCLIGMGAIILDETTIGEECLVGAGSLVPEGKQFPPRTLILGSPAKVIRELRPEEISGLSKASAHYVQLGAEYIRSLKTLP